MRVFGKLRWYHEGCESLSSLGERLIHLVMKIMRRELKVKNGSGVGGLVYMERLSAIGDQQSAAEC